MVPKEDSVKDRIKRTVCGNLLFKPLDREQLEAVVLSMEEIKVQRGEAIIRQGDEGHHFYVVDRRGLVAIVTAMVSVVAAGDKGYHSHHSERRRGVARDGYGGGG